MGIVNLKRDNRGLESITEHVVRPESFMEDAARGKCAVMKVKRMG